MLVNLLISFCLQIISGLLLVPLSVALMVLLGWHIYLILQNKTTIEVIRTQHIMLIHFYTFVSQFDLVMKIHCVIGLSLTVPWRYQSIVSCRKRRECLYKFLWSWCLWKSDIRKTIAPYLISFLVSILNWQALLFSSSIFQVIVHEAGIVGFLVTHKKGKKEKKSL